MRSVVVYVAIISFTLGIAWQSIFRQNTTFVVFLLVLSGALALLVLVTRTIRPSFTFKSLIVLLVIVTVFILGVLRMQIAQERSDISLQELLIYQDSQVEIRGVIVSEPDKREYSTNLRVKLLSVDGNDIETAQSLYVLVKASAHKDFYYGDVVQVGGKLEKVKNFISEDTGKEFNYVGYLKKDGIQYVIKRASVTIKQSNTSTGLRGFLFSIKGKYLSVIEQNIPEPESALAGGITVGSKQSLGKELLEEFRKTGVIHIVVLSGFNVAIIAIFLTYIFSFAGGNIGRVLAAIGIILFALLTGGGATVVRASAMGLLTLMALTVRRKYAVLRALFVVGFAMLLFNPATLLSDISFQLSFVATLGMILGLPILQSKLLFITTRFSLRDIVSATVATQIAVSPLLLYYMGEISVVAIVANTLILPIVSISMLVVFLTGVIGMLGGALAVPFAYAAYALLHIMISIVSALSQAPFITIGINKFNMWWVLLSYLAIGIVLWLYKPTRYNTPVNVI